MPSYEDVMPGALVHVLQSHCGPETKARMLRIAKRDRWEAWILDCIVVLLN